MPARRSPIGRRISIHALREEGDGLCACRSESWVGFLSTPSVRRATALRAGRPADHAISIHALREEGDSPFTSIVLMFA